MRKERDITVGPLPLIEIYSPLSADDLEYLCDFREGDVVVRSARKVLPNKAYEIYQNIARSAEPRKLTMVSALYYKEMQKEALKYAAKILDHETVHNLSRELGEVAITIGSTHDLERIRTFAQNLPDETRDKCSFPEIISYEIIHNKLDNPTKPKDDFASINFHLRNIIVRFPAYKEFGILCARFNSSTFEKNLTFLKENFNAVFADRFTEKFDSDFVASKTKVGREDLEYKRWEEGREEGGVVKTREREESRECTSPFLDKETPSPVVSPATKGYNGDSFAATAAAAVAARKSPPPPTSSSAFAARNSGGRR